MNLTLNEQKILIEFLAHLDERDTCNTKPKKLLQDREEIDKIKGFKGFM
ncbi:hypothetical protein [Clostridium sp.]|nr:hypothetical protein [Clostridium sp.]MBK5234910.1 hypothetical protein [Clostridium sp.]